MQLLKQLLREEDGPTAVEYAVMLALIVVTCMAAIQSMTAATASSFNQSGDAITTAMQGGG